MKQNNKNLPCIPEGDMARSKRNSKVDTNLSKFKTCSSVNSLKEKVHTNVQPQLYYYTAIIIILFYQINYQINKAKDKKRLSRFASLGHQIVLMYAKVTVDCLHQQKL